MVKHQNNESGSAKWLYKKNLEGKICSSTLRKYPTWYCACICTNEHSRFTVCVPICVWLSGKWRVRSGIQWVSMPIGVRVSMLKDRCGGFALLNAALSSLLYLSHTQRVLPQTVVRRQCPHLRYPSRSHLHPQVGNHALVSCPSFLPFQHACLLLCVHRSCFSSFTMGFLNCSSTTHMFTHKQRI